MREPRKNALGQEGLRWSPDGADRGQPRAKISQLLEPTNQRCFGHLLECPLKQPHQPLAAAPGSPQTPSLCHVFCPRTGHAQGTSCCNLSGAMLALRMHGAHISGRWPKQHLASSKCPLLLWPSPGRFPKAARTSPLLLHQDPHKPPGANLGPQASKLGGD